MNLNQVLATILAGVLLVLLGTVEAAEAAEAVQAVEAVATMVVVGRRGCLKLNERS